ncbi:MAG: hypothetical protein KAQ92_06835 [Candidatus Aenigmarchaeota archaeon]|nr:hypothetical protein [Candidatus Aenigmarchaeota archaeon]
MKKEDKEFNKAMVIVTVFIFICVTVVFLLFDDKKQIDELSAKCLEMQNHPDLQYECQCVPTYLLNNTDDGEYVKERTEEMCTCACDIGTDTPYVVEIRVADDVASLNNNN